MAGTLTAVVDSHVEQYLLVVKLFLTLFFYCTRYNETSLGAHY